MVKPLYSIKKMVSGVFGDTGRMKKWVGEGR